MNNIIMETNKNITYVKPETYRLISIQNKEEMVYSIANVIILNNGDVDKLHIEVEKQLSLLPKF